MNNKTFTATFKQIRSWPADEYGWHVDPKTGLRAKVGSRIGADSPITAGDWFEAGDYFLAREGFNVGKNFHVGIRCFVGLNFKVGDRFIAGNYFITSDNFSSGNDFTTGNDFFAEPNAIFGDNATPPYITGSRYSIGYTGKPGYIRSGCILKPVDWWLENVERCAHEHQYTIAQQKEYRLHVEHIVKWMELYGYMG